MDLEKELDLYLRARFTLVVLVTPEEERALNVIKTVCEKSQRACITWDLSDGFVALAGGLGGVSQAKEPISALDAIDKTGGNALFVLKDFHELWNNAAIKRKLRSVSQRLKMSKKSLLITTPLAKLPEELKDEVSLLDFALPKAEDMSGLLDGLVQATGIKVNLPRLGKEKLVQAALGMTVSQARRTFSKAIVSSNGQINSDHIQMVTEEKKQIIRESEALEFYGVSETAEDVGGLGVLKDWLRLRERAFSKEASDYGLPSPKGIILVGIPGTGKSLTAKMIGGLWRIPLLRLDVGSLFGSLVGESEERTRRALMLAETISPCILWIDEMEKAFSFGGFDGGTSRRVFGTILTWMQEKTAPVFVVATANDITGLPPELLRKGRFDEIFFLDLPTLEERREIFGVHLRKRRRLPQDFDVDRLARESNGFVGAELEQVIIDGMYVGFNQNREFSSDDVSRAIRNLVPLSITQRETIQQLREFLHEGRAQSASFRELTEAEQQSVPLQLELGPNGWRIRPSDSAAS
jgi:SpoVK/Ycf46/Vps4 family AAA+-type ATPase